MYRPARTSISNWAGCPEVLRHPPARRPAEPGHQRHRQISRPQCSRPDQAITSIPPSSGVLLMMIWISPSARGDLIAHCALVVPGHVAIAKRSQKQFVGQWHWTGVVNGHVEGDVHRSRAGPRSSGHRRQAIRDFDAANEQMYEQFQGAVHLRHHPARDDVRVEPELRGDRVIGGLRVANGSVMSLGDVQAFIQYPGSSRCHHAAGQHHQPAAVRVASAERVFELLDETGGGTGPADPVRLGRPRAPHRAARRRLRYTPDVPLIDDAEPGRPAG